MSPPAKRKPAPPQMDPDNYPLLTPRHADNIVESVRTLNATIARAEDQRARDHREAVLLEQQRRADHREHMEALRAFAELIRPPNGAGRAEPADKEDSDGAQDPDRHE